jgi:hypothetical protein
MADGQPVPLALHRAQTTARQRPGVFHYLATARGFVMPDRHQRELAETLAEVELAAMPKDERAAIHALAAKWRKA